MFTSFRIKLAQLCFRMAVRLGEPYLATHALRELKGFEGAWRQASSPDRQRPRPLP
ncbi:hypothetical protein OPKNFCMD_4566 [Methylobacterium crusticola]|uniref:HEPN domain-containing protein n=1 Tax=Methylobacterium crusticola TaxID=1697972 RepID=A0ABQ4R2A0_9HYPH|nr:hypothetical protein OPKNFCMD_4566 [Methylobacterium crusticola]